MKMMANICYYPQIYRKNKTALKVLDSVSGPRLTRPCPLTHGTYLLRWAATTLLSECLYRGGFVFFKGLIGNNSGYGYRLATDFERCFYVFMAQTTCPRRHYDFQLGCGCRTVLFQLNPAETGCGEESRAEDIVLIILLHGSCIMI